MTAARLIRICRNRLLSLVRKENLDDQLDQELSFHLEQLRQENIEAGMRPDEARREAKRALGNVKVLKEQCRDQRRVSWLHDFRQDARYGLGMMRKHAGFTAIAAISLALAIGGNAAILSVGSSLWFGSLPLPDAERLVMVGMDPGLKRQGNGLVTAPDYAAWKKSNRSFESMGASFANSQDLSADHTGSYPERVNGQAVTLSMFETLNVQPMLGRVFLEEEVQIGAPEPVIVLSHRLWQRRFGSDPEIVGKQIRMNARNRKVIGVMPAGFSPNKLVEYWIPLAFTTSQLEGSERLFVVTGRLKAGTTVGQARTDLESIAGQLANDHPDRYKDSRVGIVTMRQAWFGWARQPLLTLQIAVILVLLIACANVSTLLLGRFSARRPEIAIRLLMGEGRGRIIRQFLTESLLLSIIGGALGLVVAWWGVQSLVGLKPPLGGVPIATSMGQNSGVFGFAALLSVISMLVFGFLPVIAGYWSPNTMKQARNPGRRWSSSGILVSFQIGLALILLISSSLLVLSFVRLARDDRGFDPKGVLTFQYRIPVQDYVRPFGTFRGMAAIDAVPQTRAIERVVDRLRALPDAESVAGASSPPVNGPLQHTVTLNVEGRALPRDAAERAATTAVYFLVTENFFPTMKTPILRGRDFDARDTAASPWVAVVNETLARRLWPDEDPIGKHFTVDAISGEREREVIGVVRDVALTYVRRGPPQPVAYTNYLQQPERYQGLSTGIYGQMTFFVRTDKDPLSLVSAVRQAAAEVDPDRPLSGIQSMEEFLGAGMGARRFSLSALGVFAVLATVLAAIGVYFVMTYSISQRTREIGGRMAMGANANKIVALAGGQALGWIAIGLLFGLLGSFAVTRLIETQLWGITSTDPATYIGVTALFVCIALAACLRPARRAMRPGASVSLRME